MSIFKGVLALSICVFIGCESKNVQPANSLTSIYVTSSISPRMPIIRPPFTTFRLSYSNMNYSYTDSHLKADSVLTKASLIGPDLMELNYYSNSFEIKIDSTRLPNGSYTNLDFEILPCQWPEPIQGMHGKSVRFGGFLGNSKAEYEFWHDGTIKIKLSFQAGTLVIAKGVPVKLQIYIDLNKALDPLLGGADLSTAIDGNHDGIISIDPTNQDGNAELADAVFTSIVKNISCKRKN